MYACFIRGPRATVIGGIEVEVERLSTCRRMGIEIVQPRKVWGAEHTPGVRREEIPRSNTRSMNAMKVHNSGEGQASATGSLVRSHNGFRVRSHEAGEPV
jgi:hypothetical protein